MKVSDIVRPQDDQTNEFAPHCALGVPKAWSAALELSYVAALEARRSNLVALSLWVSGLGGLLALSTTEATHVEHGRLIIDAGLLLASALGTVTALSMTLQAFASDNEAKLISLTAVHPIPRWTLVVGKTIGLFVVLTAMVAIIGASSWALLRVCGETPPQAMGYAFAMLPLELLVVQTTTTLFSTLAARPYAAAMAVGLLIAGNLSEDIVLWAQNPHAEKQALLLYALHAVLPDYAKLSLRGYAANALDVPAGLWLQTAAYALLYASVALVLAAIGYSRRRSL